MKGMGDFDGIEAVDEETRVGPIPLTVKRPSAKTPVDFDFPVVASIDVDLGTPAPLPFPITISAKPVSGKPSPAPRRGAPTMQPRPPIDNGLRPGQGRPYIKPTPTFSFTNPESGPLWVQPLQQQPPPRGRSGLGLFAIGVLMAVAGVGGYMTVKYHAWQEVEPLLARAKELGRSLRTLAPGATPEAAPAVGANAAPPPAPAPPVLRPTVVPIEPAAPPPTAAPTARAAERIKKHRSPARRHGRPLQPLSDEAAAEEALLAAPSRGR